MPRRRFTALTFGALTSAVAVSALDVSTAAADPWPTSVPNIAELRALSRPSSVPSGTTISVQGYWAGGDGGGGRFVWDPTATQPDNGGTVIILDVDRESGRPGRWLRPWLEGLSVRWFGARGDGVNLDDAAIAAAFATAATRPSTTVRFPAATTAYLISHAIRISTGAVSVVGLGTGRSTTIKQTRWGLAVFDVRLADDVSISNLTLLTNYVDRSVRPDVATIAEGGVLVFNAGVFSNGHRTRVSDVTIDGFISGVLLTTYNWPTNRFELSLREDCSVIDVDVRNVDFGFVTVGQLRPVVRRLRGSFSKSYYNADPHLMYWSGSEAQPTTLSYDVLIQDCHALGGPQGDAYRLGGIIRGRMENCKAERCAGLISIGDCHDLQISNIASQEDAALNWSVYISPTTSNVTLSGVEVRRATPNVMTVRCDGSSITLDGVDLRVRHTTWPSGPDIRVAGNNNVLRKVNIANSESTGGSLGIQFLSGIGHSLRGFTATGLHKGMFVGDLRDSSFGYDPKVIQLNPDIDAAGRLLVQYTEPPVSVIADPGVRFNRESCSRTYPSSAPVTVEAPAVTDAHVAATGDVSITNTVQQAVGMRLNYHIANLTDGQISVTWGSTFVLPATFSRVDAGTTLVVPVEYRSDRRWYAV